MKRAAFIERAALILLVLCVAGVGTFNLAQRRELAVSIAHDGKNIVITEVQSGSQAQKAGIRTRDVVRAIRGHAIEEVAYADWEIHRALPGETIFCEIQRGDSLFEVGLKAEQPMAHGFLFLNQIIGLIFAVLGIAVWWAGGRDPTVVAFLRLNILASVAILLDSQYSVFASLGPRALYGTAWLGAYLFLPASLADFLFRFPRFTSFRRTARLLLFYAPFALVFAIAGASYIAAVLSDNPDWVTRFMFLFRIVFGSLLVLYITLSLCRLIYVAWRPLNESEKNQNRWLLLCTVVGVSPFIFLNKLPTVFGWPPLLSSTTAISFLLLVPVGWGMAVASFRMLKVEWTLSRSIVYLLSAGIALYAVAALLILSSGGLHPKPLFSSAVLWGMAGLLLILAVLALVDRLKGLLDRLYYGDWFDLQRALHDLSGKLSGTLLERDIVRILTEELPALLKIDRALLIRVSPEQIQIASETSPDAEELRRMISTESFQQELRRLYGVDTGMRVLASDDPLAAFGHRLAVPLVHIGELKGWLLLGRKLSRAPYGQRDFQLLETLPTVAGLALSNVELNSRLLAQERRTMVATLASGIAHEINNALYPLLGQAQLIEVAASRSSGEVAADKVSQSAQIIGDMCARIKRIADNLNHLSEPSTLKIVSFSLNDAARDALRLLAETAGRIKRFERDNPQARFRLVMVFDERLPQVRGDPDQLSQVFVNLILNASDAMEGQAHGVLTVGTHLADDHRHVAGFVEDTGAGIPRELHDKIFQPYFTTKPRDKGTGLGLAIVRSIIEAHGGSVRLNSTPGVGTRVEFLLPIPPLSSSS